MGAASSFSFASFSVRAQESHAISIIITSVLVCIMVAFFCMAIHACRTAGEVDAFLTSSGPNLPRQQMLLASSPAVPTLPGVVPLPGLGATPSPVQPSFAALARLDDGSHSPTPAQLAPLCPQLVVPQGTESELFLPVLGATKEWNCSTVLSPQGSVLLEASFRPLLQASPPTPGVRNRGPESQCLTLSGPGANCIFARALQIKDSKTVAIHDHADVFYGDLGAVDTSSFFLTTRRGPKIYFHCDRLVGSIVATDGDGRQMAVVEPRPKVSNSNGRRKIAIGPLVDAGLMILCVLTIDWVY